MLKMIICHRRESDVPLVMTWLPSCNRSRAPDKPRESRAHFGAHLPFGDLIRQSGLTRSLKPCATPNSDESGECAAKEKSLHLQALDLALPAISYQPRLTSQQQGFSSARRLEWVFCPSHCHRSSSFICGATGGQAETQPW